MPERPSKNVQKMHPKICADATTLLIGWHMPRRCQPCDLSEAGNVGFARGTNLAVHSECKERR